MNLKISSDYIIVESKKHILKAGDIVVIVGSKARTIQCEDWGNCVYDYDCDKESTLIIFFLFHVYHALSTYSMTQLVS